MKREMVDRFFLEVSRYWKHPTQVFLLGGAGALILGGARPTLDVDFEVRFVSHAPAPWDDFEEAVRKASLKTGLGAQYAESVERWSSLTLLDYRRHARRVGSFGAIEVRVLEPEYWSIGKMGRYWDQDIQDMRTVFRRQRPDPMRLSRIWSKAIAQSPKSTQLALARRQALHFFQTFGKEIWGDSFPSASVQRLFVPKAKSARKSDA